MSLFHLGFQLDLFLFFLSFIIFARVHFFVSFQFAGIIQPISFILSWLLVTHVARATFKCRQDHQKVEDIFANIFVSTVLFTSLHISTSSRGEEDYFPSYFADIFC